MSRRHLAILVANLALACAARADSLLSALLSQPLPNAGHEFLVDGRPDASFTELVRDVATSVGSQPRDWSDPGAVITQWLIANPFVSFDMSFPLHAGQYLIDETPEGIAANEQAIQAYHGGYASISLNFHPVDAPEPGAGGMVLLGIGGLAYARRRRTLRRSAAAACRR
jgi:hypothetical protein